MYNLTFTLCQTIWNLMPFCLWSFTQMYLICEFYTNQWTRRNSYWHKCNWEQKLILMSTGEIKHNVFKDWRTCLCYVKYLWCCILFTLRCLHGSHSFRPTFEMHWGLHKRSCFALLWKYSYYININFITNHYVQVSCHLKLLHKVVYVAVVLDSIIKWHIPVSCSMLKVHCLMLFFYTDMRPRTSFGMQ